MFFDVTLTIIFVNVSMVVEWKYFSCPPQSDSWRWIESRLPLHSSTHI